MKELTIEEKAKRYDEVIETFDIILNLNTVKESGTIFADDVRKILPELKESEDLENMSYHSAMEFINDPKFLPTTTFSELIPMLQKLYKDGAKWQKEQIMKDALECVVKVGAGGYHYIDRCVGFYDYDKDIPLAKEGDKVKIVVIKGE